MMFVRSPVSSISLDLDGGEGTPASLGKGKDGFAAGFGVALRFLRCFSLWGFGSGASVS